MSTIGGVVTGGITTKTGIVRPFFQVGFVVLALGMGLDSLWTAAMPYWQQAILLGLTGFGFGLVIVSFGKTFVDVISPLPPTTKTPPSSIPSR